MGCKFNLYGVEKKKRMKKRKKAKRKGRGREGEVIAEIC